MLPCINRLFTTCSSRELANDPETRATRSPMSPSTSMTPTSEASVTRAHLYEGTCRPQCQRRVRRDRPDSGWPRSVSGRAISLYSYFVDAADVVQLLPVLVDTSVARLDTALA